MSNWKSFNPPRPVLLWRDAQGVERSLELTAGVIHIGRAADCAIRIDDARLARHHARIFPGDGGYVLEDLASWRGVYVQEQRVQRRVLEHGDVIRCGSHTLCFFDREAADRPSVSVTGGEPGTSGSAPVRADGVEPARVRSMPDRAVNAGPPSAVVRSMPARVLPILAPVQPMPAPVQSMPGPAQGMPDPVPARPLEVKRQIHWPDPVEESAFEAGVGPLRAEPPAIGVKVSASLSRRRRSARTDAERPAIGVEASAPRPVHWNTRVLDGERALDELFVTVGCAYAIETGLDPVPLPDAVASSTLTPGGLPDGTRVTFEVSCPQPILRGHGDSAGEPAARVTHTATYEAATGRCPPARFGLVPAAPGRIPLTVNVVTGNALRASTRLALLAEAAATQPLGLAPSLPGPSAPPARLAPPAPLARPAPSPRPIEVSVAALTGPAAQLRFELTATNQIVISDGVVNEPPRRTSSSWSTLITEAITARKELVELSGAYRRDPGRPSELALADASALRLRMAKIGARLHREFFGTPGDRRTDSDTRRLAQAIADTPPGARLQIVAAFQPFPWAVLYDGAYRGKPLTDDPASVDLSCFWGHRFRIDRMIMGHASAGRAPALPAPVRVQPCLNPHLDDEPAAKALGVRVVASQRALFDGLPDVMARPRIESTDGFLAYLRSPTAACDLLYVFCHATAAATRDELFTYTDRAPDTLAKLIFEPPPVAPVDVRAMQEARDGLLVDRPLVFLNACSSAAGDEAFQSPLLEQFLERWGAIGVLGTDWEVPTAFADAFSRRLLDHFLREHRPLGVALWLASQEAFAEGNPFPLIYALYARPELTTTTATTAASTPAPR